MAKPKEDKFTEIDELVQEKFDQVYADLNFITDVDIKLINANNQKQCVKLEKCNDKVKFLTGHDMLLLVNEEIFLELDERAQDILLLQELDRIHIDMEKDRIQMSKPDIVTFSGIVKKYGMEEVARANQLFDLAQQQKNEKHEEFAQ